MKKQYQTNIEDLLEKIRKNTATTNLSAESLALDVSVDGIEDLLTSILAAQNAALSGSQVQVDIIDSTLLTAIKNAVELMDNSIHVDDAAFTLGTHSGTMMMGFAGTQSVNANDAGAIAMDTDGAIHVSDGGNTITVDGTVTANLSSTDNDVLDAMVVDLAAIEIATEASVVKLGEIDTAIDTIDGVLDSSLTKLTEIDTAIDTIDGVLDSSLTKLGEIETTNNANQVLLGTIDSDTSSLPGMATSLAALDNAVDGNYINTNLNIAGTDVAANSGNKSAVTQRVVLATDDIPTALINTNLATLETDVEATNTLLTAIKANQLLMLGESGAVTISGTTAVSESAGTYCAVNFIKASTPDPLTITGVTTIAEVEYPAGTWLYGDVTDITCDADALYILYKGNPA